MRWLLIAVLPFLAAGCTSVNDPFLETGAIRPDGPPISTEVSPEFATAYLPSISGRIESVRQTVRGDFLQQAIVYSNATASAGENVLTVRIGTPSSSGGVFLHAPTRRAILAEMRDVLPGVAMTMNPSPGQNLQGVYGYATGPLGTSGSCLYAWQFAKRISPLRELLADRLAAANYAAQVRLRFCHPTVPQERIASIMNGMRLKPVTDQTIDMLQFAGGSGREHRQPVLLAAEPAVIADDAAPPRRTLKRRVAEEKQAEEPAVIRNAVRVPLPGETARETAKAIASEKPAEKVGETVTAQARGVLVPIPETASLSGAE